MGNLRGYGNRIRKSATNRLRNKMTKPKTLNSYERTRQTYECVGPSLTKQASKDETDINFIMKKYQKTGIVEHVNEFQGNYQDVSGSQPYQESLNQVIAAQAAFDSLPSSVRAKFQNDPGVFLTFVNTPGNRDELIKLGLIQQEYQDPGEATPRESSVAEATPSEE
jgi:phage internal scaffolding protein